MTTVIQHPKRVFVNLCGNGYISCYCGSLCATFPMLHALSVLLKFFSAFVQVFGHAFASDNLQKCFPEILLSTNTAHQLLWNTKESDFTEFVLCPKCHSVSEYSDYIVVRHGQEESKVCSHVAYPNHPHHSKRIACGATLLKNIRSGEGYRLTPFKVYPYKPLYKSLTYLVQKESFVDACMRNIEGQEGTDF